VEQTQNNSIETFSNKQVEISDKLKQRFCKDNNIAIQVYEEPIFTNRLELLGYSDKWNQFIDMFNTKFDGDEQSYFQHYNSLKDSIIDFIKQSPAYTQLLADDMTKYTVNSNVSQGDIFKHPYIGKRFISIDIKKANFTALAHYGIQNKLSFNPASQDKYDYNAFMHMFTSIDYFVESKYIRQVVFGNCCAKRQVAYEKYITAGIYKEITEDIEKKTGSSNTKDALLTFCNDELVFDADKLAVGEIAIIKNYVEKTEISLRMEYFKLGKAENTDTYIKYILGTTEKNRESDYELKCNNPVETILVTKVLKGLQIIPEDLIFTSQYGTAQLLKVPDIKITFGDK
jgi:hypothetical protein